MPDEPNKEPSADLDLVAVLQERFMRKYCDRSFVRWGEVYKFFGFTAALTKKQSRQLLKKFTERDSSLHTNIFGVHLP